MEEQAAFEFSTSQNQLVGSLAGKMKWVAYFLFAGAGLLVVFSLLAFEELGLGGVFQAILMLVIGLWTKKAATAFRLIVETEGRDIANLMDAILELKRLYTLQFWLSIAAIVLGVTGGIIAFLSALPN